MLCFPGSTSVIKPCCCAPATLPQQADPAHPVPSCKELALLRRIQMGQFSLSSGYPSLTKINLHRKVLWCSTCLLSCLGLSVSQFLAKIIIYFWGLIHRLFFLPSYGLSGATDIPFLSTRARLAQSCQRPHWQLQRQPSGNPALLHPFQNLWDYFLSSEALRYVPLLDDKLLLQLCLHVQFGQHNKSLDPFKCQYLVHSINLGCSERHYQLLPNGSLIQTQETP